MALERHVARLDHGAALAEIYAYRKNVYKDRPAGSLSDEDARPTIVPKPAPHWCDDLVLFFGESFHWSRDEVLDCPFAQLYQLWRARALARGDEVIDEVAALAVDYANRALAAHREQMALNSQPSTLN